MGGLSTGAAVIGLTVHRISGNRVDSQPDYFLPELHAGLNISHELTFCYLKK